MGEEQHMEQTNGLEAQLCQYNACLPHLLVEAPRAADAIAFYKRAFGAEEVTKTLHKRKADQEMPLVLHAHLKFGSVEIMLCDEVNETGPNVEPPSKLKGTAAILHVVTDNADAAFQRALDAGATEVEKMADQPWGMRYGKLMDPYGFAWSFGTPLKELESNEGEALH